MAVIEAIKQFHDEMTGWRRDIHQHPELAFEESRTSDFVVQKLKEFGIEVHQGLAKTGVVGTIKNGEGPSIGLRADLDALPLMERNDFEYASSNPGKMHACGHDGHTTMLLGAAKYLSETKNFKGTVQLIFQPAEEGGAGGNVMVREGIFEKFPVDAIYGLHNWPGMTTGHFGVKAGALMAAVDTFDLTVFGVSGHAAMPDQCVDPIVAAAQIVTALQTISSRKTHPLDSVVISVTQIHAGDAYNVIPDEVLMRGTIRSFLPETRDSLPNSIQTIADGICTAMGTTCKLEIEKGYPAVVNSEVETEKAAKAVVDVAGEDKIVRNPIPSMGAEDFSYFLQERPGSYIWLGNGHGKGEAGCMLHNSHYDFNDDVLPIGVAYWVTLVENELPA